MFKVEVINSHIQTRMHVCMYECAYVYMRVCVCTRNTVRQMVSRCAISRQSFDGNVIRVGMLAKDITSHPISVFLQRPG